jgi:hypothetical protein
MILSLLLGQIKWKNSEFSSLWQRPEIEPTIKISSKFAGELIPWYLGHEYGFA